MLIVFLICVYFYRKFSSYFCTIIWNSLKFYEIIIDSNFFFILLLIWQRLVDKENRVHCSLNLNTETGRLSSRKPNLQNQPALEKDQYKIRTLQIFYYFQEKFEFLFILYGFWKRKYWELYLYKLIICILINYMYIN